MNTEQILNIMVPTSLLIEENSPLEVVEFNEELAAEQSFKFWEAPHLRRCDGSYTNW